MINQRFGRLIVLEDSGLREGNAVVKWRCLCDCGNETIVNTYNLRLGSTRSCGCLQAEVFREFLDRDTVEKGTRLTSIASDSWNKRNTSGVRGVSYNKHNGNWSSQLMLKGEYKLNTSFATREEAIQARLEAEEKYFKPIRDKYEVKE